MTTNVALLFGGQSAEHPVSIRSAKKVSAELKSAEYDVTLIGIDQMGVWRLAPFVAAPRSHWPEVVLRPGGGGQLLVIGNSPIKLGIDVVFPMLHGPCGEDGTVQGLCRLANVACVGADSLASAICMDKDVSKRLLHAAGIPTTPSRTFRRDEGVSYALLVTQLGLPLVVKPANMGSSIGVSKVADEPGLREALATAFRFDDKVIVESYISGREIECAVLLTDEPFAASPGEIVIETADDLYSYEEKYAQHSHAELRCPADLPATLKQTIQVQAIAASRVLGVDGMVRVDFFVADDGRLLVNELNTLPGFTEISLYPKLMQASGLPTRELVRRLIDRAQQNQQTAMQRQQSHTPSEFSSVMTHILTDSKPSDSQPATALIQSEAH